MSYRASIFEKPRIGVETAQGTSVPATMVLQSLTVTPKPVLVRNPIKVNGVIGAVGVTSAKGHTEFSYDSAACYGDLAVLLSSLLCKPVSGVAVSGYLTSLTYKPTPDAANDMASFTVECGSVNGAASFPGAWINDLTLAISKTDVKVSGNGMGYLLTDGITLTSDPTNVPLVPVAINTIDVYVASTYSGLSNSGNKMEALTSANWSLTGRRTGALMLDSAQASYSGTVERASDLKAQIVCQLDSQGIGVMTHYANADIVWVRYKATGPAVASGQGYSLQISFPCYVDANTRSDVDDIYSGTFDLVPVTVMDGSFDSYVEVIIDLADADAANVPVAS